MLTPEEIDGVILAGSYRNAAGGIYTTCTEDFARDIETLATAEARALVRQLVQALETGREATYELAQAFHTAYKGHRAEEHAAADADVQRLDIALAAARAWLGEAQKGDGHHG